MKVGAAVKAVILNSGLGKRMGEETKNKPKCMVEIAPQQTIVSRQIKQLIKYGIDEFIITTGPFANELQNYVGTVFPHLKVTYVPNPRYASTNYIYSLFLAKEYLTGEFLLLHGDLVFADDVLAKTLQSSHPNTVLVNREAALPEKDFKARLTNGQVQEISIHIFGDDCAFLIPLYKLSPTLSQDWLVEIEKFVQRGELNVYAENALNNILFRHSLLPVFFAQELCTEIDNPADLQKVRTALAAEGQA